jgi:hypothetical protein
MRGPLTRVLLEAAAAHQLHIATWPQQHISCTLRRGGRSSTSAAHCDVARVSRKVAPLILQIAHLQDTAKLFVE